MLHDRILVEVDKDSGERRSSGGIVIPATASVGRRLSWATAVGIGPNVRSIVVGDRVLYDPDDRSEVEPTVDDAGRPLDAALADYEKKLIIAALGENGNNQVRTAEALGLSRQGLIKKMKRLGVSSSGEALNGDDS